MNLENLVVYDFSDLNLEKKKSEFCYGNNSCDSGDCDMCDSCDHGW